jgi:hypothetical protein
MFKPGDLVRITSSLTRTRLWFGFVLATNDDTDEIFILTATGMGWTWKVQFEHV